MVEHSPHSKYQLVIFGLQHNLLKNGTKLKVSDTVHCRQRLSERHHNFKITPQVNEPRKNNNNIDRTSTTVSALIIVASQQETRLLQRDSMMHYIR